MRSHSGDCACAALHSSSPVAAGRFLMVLCSRSLTSCSPWCVLPLYLMLRSRDSLGPHDFIEFGLALGARSLQDIPDTFDVGGAHINFERVHIDNEPLGPLVIGVQDSDTDALDAHCRNFSAIDASVPRTCSPDWWLYLFAMTKVRCPSASATSASVAPFMVM